jgi:hypothetical protein
VSNPKQDEFGIVVVGFVDTLLKVSGEPFL